MAITLDRTTAIPPAEVGAGPHRRIAGLLGVAAVALAIAAVAIDESGVDAALVVQVGLVVAWSLAGGVLLARPSLRRLGLVTLIGAVTGAVGVFCDSAVTAGWTGGAGDAAQV